MVIDAQSRFAGKRAPMWFKILPLSTFSFFDERRTQSWRLAAALVLAIAVLTVGRAPHNALFLMGMAIAAGLISILVETRLDIRAGKLRVPRSSLALWWIITLVVSLHTGFPVLSGKVVGFGISKLGLPSSIVEVKASLWVLLGLAGIGVSFGFNGSRALLAAIGTMFLVAGLASYEGVSAEEIWTSESIFLLLSFAIAASVLMFRYSRAMTNQLEVTLVGLVQRASETKFSLNRQIEELALVREGLLGSTDTQGEQAGSGSIEWVKNRNLNFESLNEARRQTMDFEHLVHVVRTVFQDFQIEAARRGETMGPVRFVFFPPASGYDSKAELAVDRDRLGDGLKVCLKLAFESLPESPGYRREGVIRLSIRRGLRVVEIAVEDNGRGLSARNEEIESGLQRLRESIESEGGRFDRVTRLGVGSRTSMEIKILRQLPHSAKYRPTLRHVGTAADLESRTGATPLSHSEF